MNDDQVMTIKEAAEYLRVSTSTLHRLAKKGEIGQKVGGRYRFVKSDLDDMLRSRSKQNQVSRIQSDLAEIREKLKEIEGNVAA